jgi:16S rRNA (cytosine1402-N4)-methyltransferase
MKPSVHKPILLDAILEALLDPKCLKELPHLFFLDATLGGGGHTKALLERLTKRGQPFTLYALDQDLEAIERAQHFLKPWIQSGNLILFHQRFSSFQSPAPLHGLLADLGFSSDQIENPERGLSFQQDGPLDMRLDRTKGVSLKEKLREVSQSTLEKVLKEYGEVRLYRKISRLLLQERENLSSTRDLANLLTRALPPQRGSRLHPATTVFQALRIWVNDELEEVKALTTHLGQQLAPSGRLLVLTFHSLEDRCIKQAPKSTFKALLKKPLRPGPHELAENPRSRSAKLRIFERIEGQ